MGASFSMMRDVDKYVLFFKGVPTPGAFVTEVTLLETEPSKHVHV